MTLRKFSQGLDAIPTGTAWYLADLGRAMGKQELFTRQSPQRLKALREHALVESAVSSNRIEGVEVEPRRVATLVFGRPSLRDRNEEEVRGYRWGRDTGTPSGSSTNRRNACPSPRTPSVSSVVSPGARSRTRGGTSGTPSYVTNEFTP
jgi:hypothetical protein